MNTDRKYFGMSIRQIGILAGLAGVALVLFCIAGSLILGRARGLFARPAASTSTPQPTPTLIIAPTLTPTPAATARPYESLIPGGWVQYLSALYEIWIPPGYKSGSPDVLISGLGGSSIPDLSVSGKYSSLSANKIYITVAYEPLGAGSLDDFLKTRLSALGPYLSLSERSKTDLNTVPVTRLVFGGRKGNNIDLSELTYVVQDGGTIWYLQYSAELSEFYEMLPTFEASALTFRFVR
jgi:hypothetical protein